MLSNPQQREQRNKRLLGLAVVLVVLVVCVTSLTRLWSGKKARWMDTGFVALRQGLDGDARGFAAAREAFLKAGRVAFWDAEPMIMVEITRKLSELSVPPGYVPPRRLDEKAWEQTLLTVIRLRRFEAARRLLAGYGDAARRRFFQMVVTRLERAGRRPR